MLYIYIFFYCVLVVVRVCLLIPHDGRLVREKQTNKMLRISASDVAAIAGYHQWVDVRDLFLERLLYQVT